MSLPFLLSRGGNASSSSYSTKARARGVGQDPHIALARTSFEAGGSIVGSKRNAQHLLLSEATDGGQLQTVYQHDEQHEAGFAAPKRPRVVVVGASPLGASLVQALLGKPGFVQPALYGASKDEVMKWQLLPGVMVHHNCVDAAKWSEIVILCGNSYQEGDEFLMGATKKYLHGTVVVQMVQGSPQQARVTAGLCASMGAKYLDACLLTTAVPSNVFGHRKTSIVASGSKEAWDLTKDLLLAVAPGSFYGSDHVEGSNAIAMGMYTVLAAMHMGLQQASTFVEKFGVQPHVLPSLLLKDFVPLVKQVVLPQLPFSTTSTGPSVSNSATNFSANSTTSTGVAASSTTPALVLPVPTYGSPAWLEQLEQIRRTCVEFNVPHDILDGLMTRSGRTTSVQQSVTQPVSANAGLVQELQHLQLHGCTVEAAALPEDNLEMGASSRPGSPCMMDVAALLGLEDATDDLFMPMASAQLGDFGGFAWAP